MWWILLGAGVAALAGGVAALDHLPPASPVTPNVAASSTVSIAATHTRPAPAVTSSAPQAANSPKPPQASPSRPSSRSPVPPQQTTVVYSITSDAPLVSVTYMTPTGSEAQQNNVTAPWSKTLPVPSGGLSFFEVLAQMEPGPGRDGTTISCAVTVAGKVISRNTSTGRFAIVTCGGSQ